MTRKKKWILGGSLLLLTLCLSFILHLTIISLGNYVIDDKMLVMNSATSIVDRDGELISRLYIENREIVPLRQIPKHVQNAFVAIEDARFYDHQGVDIRSISRALYRDIIAGAKVEGGSTITQQLAKNTFLSQDKTWLRKTKEVLISMNLERKYSKDELLELYLNRIYFGHGAYGIQSASHFYFNKDVSELTVDEGALLAALPKAPNAFSPLVNEERSKERRDLVLQVMEKRGYLSAEEVVRLQGRTLGINTSKQLDEKVAYLTYIDMILDEAEEKYKLTNEEVLSGGYTIVVPMNQEVQERSYEILKSDQYFPDQNKDVEAAFILMENDTGGVIAAHGGRNYVSKGINRVNVKRQPGSVIKPIAVYSPALEEGISKPYSLLRDELAEYDNEYVPHNHNQRYEGEMTMYDALTQSANAPAVWLLNEIGIPLSKSYLNRFRLPTEDDGLSIALGGLSEGYSPIELSTAFRAFAREGKLVEPYFIEELYDQNGELVGRATVNEQKVISTQTAWYITRMLENVVREGTASAGQSVHPLAGKTGTTSFVEVEGAARDAWFVGYTPDVVGAVWMGYDITTTDQYLEGGSSYATILFKDIVNELPESNMVTQFVKPQEVKDLDPPIRFEPVQDLKASLTLQGAGLVNVRLNWSEPMDSRLEYNVYEVTKNEGTKKIATVKGSEFIVNRVNPFSLQEYFITPYNPQIDREGEASNTVPVDLKFNLFQF